MAVKADIEAPPAPAPVPATSSSPNASRSSKQSRLSYTLPPFILISFLFCYEFLMLWVMFVNFTPITRIQQRLLEQLPLWSLLNLANIAFGCICSGLWTFSRLEEKEAERRARERAGWWVFSGQLIVILVCLLLQVLYGVLGPRLVSWVWTV